MNDDRHHKRRSACRTEQERGLRVTTTRRSEPDVEALARLVRQLALEDPLGLATSHDLAKLSTT
ncbi:MAG: hypothetical protein LBI33_10070 [Propionibacteriaceae bacterium]|nr:hypothetical protein [Propionibacteriaceae bacterium]